MKRIYAVGISAKVGVPGAVRISLSSLSLLARSVPEAAGFALEEARKRWPVESGWYEHLAHATEVPDELIEVVCKQT